MKLATSNHAFRIASVAGAFVLCTGLVIFGLGRFWFDSFQSLVSPEKKDRVRIAMAKNPNNGLILLALAEGYFEREGLEIEIVETSSGRDALDMVIRGDVDFASAYQTPVSRRLLEGVDLRILTELHSSGSLGVLVTRSQSRSEDHFRLDGLRFGVTKNTSADFLLDLVLADQGQDRASAEVLYLEPTKIEAELEAGRLDAAILWEPIATNFLSRAGGSFRRKEIDFYSEISMLVAQTNTVETRGLLIRRLLRALNASEQAIEAENTRAVAVMTERGYFTKNDASFGRVWANISLKLGLSTLLVTMLNEEAAWYVRRGLEAKIDPYDSFSRFLAPEFLLELRPETVTVR